jgi:hypothetical protein
MCGVTRSQVTLVDRGPGAGAGPPTNGSGVAGGSHFGGSEVSEQLGTPGATFKFTVVGVGGTGAAKKMTAPVHSFDACMAAIARDLALDPATHAFTYQDEEGLTVQVDTSAGLSEALTYAREANIKALRVTLVKRKARGGARGAAGGGAAGGLPVPVMVGGGVALALLVVVGFVVSRPKK